MIKKLISVSIACLLLCCSAFISFASPTTPEISVSQNGYSIVVTVAAKEKAKGSVAAFIKSSDTTDLTYYGMDDTKEYTEEEGNFIYTITMKMGGNVASGDYVVAVDNGVMTTKTFTYVSVDDKVKFFNTLNGAQPTQIYGLLTGEDCRASYDFTAYKALYGTSVLALVDAEIADWNLAATLETIDTVEKNFSESMDEVMTRAGIVCATEDTFGDVVKTAMKAGKLDDTYYKSLDAKAVYKFMHPETLTTITYEEIGTRFNEAVLLATYDTMDYLFLREAYLYFADKKVVALDQDKYETLVDEKLDDDLFKAVKETDNLTDIDSLETAVDEETDKLLEHLEEEDDNTTTNSGGRPAGGGGSRPSNGNTSMGSGTNAEKPTETKPSVTFSDLAAVPWAEKAIVSLAQEGILSGRGDGNFYPNDTVTREEFVKMLVEVFGVKEENVTCNFSDVDKTRWSYTYIASANRLGLVKGIDETHFYPNGLVTREDMATMIYRAFTMVKGETASKALSFTDETSISAYAKEAVAKLAGLGVVNGMGDGTFAPKGNVTRAQAAKALYEVKELLK